MTTKEAIKIIEDFAEATRILKVEASTAEHNRNSVSSLRQRVKELEAESRQNRNLQRNITMLEKASGFEICKQCDGDGGVYIDMGEAGAEGYECDVCNGAGIIKTI